MAALESDLAQVSELNGVTESPTDTFIIGAGFGRTGTSSMKIALEKLGWRSDLSFFIPTSSIHHRVRIPSSAIYRSYHMREVFGGGQHAMDSLITVGKLKCELREETAQYDASFGNFDQMVLSPDAFDWNQLFKDKDGGKYNAVCFSFLSSIQFKNSRFCIHIVYPDCGLSSLRLLSGSDGIL